MFEVGKEVLCIKSHSMGMVNRGEKYIILNIVKGCKHTPTLLDLGLTPLPGYSMSSYCNTCQRRAYGAVYLDSSLFAPIDNTLSETTIEQLLNEPETVEI